MEDKSLEARIKSLEQEKDLYIQKIYRLHDRFDAQDRKLNWILSHPFRFVLSWCYHYRIKKDRKI